MLNSKEVIKDSKFFKLIKENNEFLKQTKNFKFLIENLADGYPSQDQKNYREYFLNKMQEAEEKKGKPFGKFTKEEKFDFFRDVDEGWESDDENIDEIIRKEKEKEMKKEEEQELNGQTNMEEDVSIISKDPMLKTFFNSIEEKPRLIRLNQLKEEMVGLLESDNSYLLKVRLNEFFKRNHVENLEDLTIEKQEKVMQEAVDYMKKYGTEKHTVFFK